MVLTRPEQLRLDLPLEAIAIVCQRYGVSEMAVFGSVLRDDFDPASSDVDFLVRFINDDAGPWAHKLMDMEEDLGNLLNRKVDVAERVGVEKSRNLARRQHILERARIIYEER